jgi:hypothetical protein
MLWNVFVIDESGVFQANPEPLNIQAAEYLAGLVSPYLTIFLYPADLELPERLAA